jgi:hypothetical protein
MPMPLSRNPLRPMRQVTIIGCSTKVANGHQMKLVTTDSTILNMENWNANLAGLADSMSNGSWKVGRCGRVGLAGMKRVDRINLFRPGRSYSPGRSR